MSINIGDNNEIKNSNLIDNITVTPNKESNFSTKHPILVGILVSMIAGIILMFKFWTNVVKFIENLF